MRIQGAEYLGPFLLSKPKLIALSSHHLCFPLPKLPNVELSAVYFIRHPIERVISVYEFERRQPGQTAGAINAKQMDIAEYVRWRLTPKAGATIRNYHVRYLAGLHRAARREVTDKDYQVASANLHSGARIGLVERYDESLVEFENSLKQTFSKLDLAYIPQNVNTSRPALAEDRVGELRSRLGESLFSELEAANSRDLSLYSEANALVEQRCASIPEFDARLHDFRSRCEALR